MCIRPPNLLKFEVAIICALYTEADAVISLFDTKLDDDGDMYIRAPGDQNSYTAGRISQHNVVVVHMSNMGKVNAAIAAQGLQSTFRDLKLALVVGICGAVPYLETKRDLFLGDVVISQTLIQYDFGRQYTTNFEAKDSNEGGLGKLPAKIQSMLAKLKTNYNRQRLETTAEHILNDLQQRDARARYPGADADKLFDSKTLHLHRKAGACHVC